MGLSDVFTSKSFLRLLRIIGIIVALGVGAISILFLIYTTVTLSPFEFLASVYICFFAALAIVAELKIVFILQWFRFLAPFLGLGFYYIFLGLFLVLRKWWGAILGGCVMAGLGVVYIIVGVCGVKRVDVSDNAKREQKDTAVKYATNKAVDTAADNKEALASAATAENGNQKPNPFNNDNPFQGGAAY